MGDGDGAVPATAGGLLTGTVAAAAVLADIGRSAFDVPVAVQQPDMTIIAASPVASTMAPLLTCFTAMETQAPGGSLRPSARMGAHELSEHRTVGSGSGWIVTLVIHAFL
jgi:hypothetical protein